MSRKLLWIVLCSVLTLMFMTAFSNLSVREAKAGSAGSGWVTDSPIYTGSSSGPRANPSISADSMGNLYVAYEHYDLTDYHFEILVSKSTNGGRTWSYVTGVSSLDTDLLNPCLAIATASQNQVLVAYERSGSGIELLKYVDGQTTLQAITYLAGAYHPSLTFDNNVPIYAYVTYEVDSTGSGSGWDIYFARSTDYSGNWTAWDTPYAIVGGGEFDDSINHMPSIAYGSSGNLYVAYVRWNPTVSTGRWLIHLMQSNSYGAMGSWTSDPGREVSEMDTANKHNPKVAASHSSPSTVIVVYDYDSAPNGLGDIDYAWSVNGGTDWNAGILYTNNADKRNPAIAVDDSNYFHLAYWQNESYGSRTNGIYYQRAYYSAPTSWTAPEQVIDNDGWASPSYNRPTISAQQRGGTFYPVIAWTDLRGTDLNVYSTTPGATYTITSSPTSIGGVPIVQVDGVNYTTPVSFNWVAGTSHIIGAPSPQVGGGFEYNFTGWNDSGSQYHQISVYTTDAVFTATFQSIVIPEFTSPVLAALLLLSISAILVWAKRKRALAI